MGREKVKRRHSHHSKYEESASEEDSSSSECDSDSSSESSDTSTSEEERRRRARKKARRASEGEERRHGKAKQKLKRRKSTKSKEKKSKKAHKISVDEISVDDYFSKSAEFRTWLSKERGVYFSDLSSEEARKLFKKFVSKWNSGILNKSYYGGIQSSAVGHSTQSNYQWQFASKVNSSDLKALRDDVSSWSSSKDNFDFSSDQAAARSSSPKAARPTIGPHPPTREAARVIGPSRDTGHHGESYSFDREEQREAETAHLKRGRKELRKQQELMLDELLPKATGKEARVEKKRARAEKRREREISPDVNDSKVYGTSSTSSIRDKVRARQDQRVNKATAAVQKISDYQAKEKARVEAIMQMAKANKKEGALW